MPIALSATAALRHHPLLLPGRTRMTGVHTGCVTQARSQGGALTAIPTASMMVGTDESCGLVLQLPVAGPCRGGAL
jgi:hypothetical protein